MYDEYWDFDELRPDTGHSQRQNTKLDKARRNDEVGPKGSDKLRDPGLDEGLSFSEALNARDFHKRS